MRRNAAIGLVLLTAVLLQTTLFARYVTLFGITPDLILIVTISLAIVEGPVVGATSGFAGGLLRDLLLAAPKGLTGLAYLLVGYMIGSLRPYVPSTSVFIPIAGIFIGSVAGTALYTGFSALLGVTLVGPAGLIRLIILTAIYNTILVPFVHPLVARVMVKVSPEKVYRW